VRRELQALEFIDARTDLFGLRDPGGELRLEREGSDNLGMTHLRFSQRYEGLRVWGCQKFVHFDSSGSIYLVAGQNIPTPSIETTPAISASAAEKTAYIDAEPEFGGRAVRSESELLIYPDGNTPQLAWLITFYAVDRGGIRYRVFVDAITGQVLHKYNDIHFDGPMVGSGTDLDSFVQTLQTYKIGSDYKLIDASHAMFKPPVGGLNGVIATYWNWHKFGGIVTDTAGDNIFDNNPGYQAAVSAHYFSQKVYEYFLNTFGYNGLSNNGSSMLSNVHDSLFPNNAYWDGTSTSYSDGDGIDWRPFCADLDIVGHEFTHAVTQFTADLIYEFEPGALSESMSDFFGNMIERKNWLIGDGIRITPPGFMRSMADPHQGLDTTLFPFGYQPSTMAEFIDTNSWFDNGAVHFNSGIPNRVGYLMAQAIGREKAEQIWFRTLTTYLTPSSSFQFWSIMLTQSVEDIYGVGSAEANATVSSLDSAGFGLLEIQPSSFPTLRKVLGSTKDVTVSVKSHRIDDVTLTGAVVAQGSMSVSGPLPITLQRGDSVVLTLTIDGTQSTECDLGTLRDTLKILTSIGSVPEMIVPIELTTAYADIGLDTAEIRTSCLISEVYNDPGVLSFGIPGLSMLNRGSFIVGRIEGMDTILYWHIDRPSTYISVDTFTRSVALNGDSLLSFRFISSDGVIHGKVQYRYEEDGAHGCRHVVADYWLTNPCGAPTLAYLGTYFDWDVDDKYSNTCSDPPFFVGSYGDTIFRGNHVVKSPSLGVSAAQMLIGHEKNHQMLGSWGYRAIWLWLYNQIGFTPQLVYRDLTLDGVSRSMGITPDDWASLAMFGAAIIGPGDTVHCSVAYMWTIGDDNTYFDQVGGIPPICCTDLTGNVDCDPANQVDISDLSRLIDRLYVSFAPLCCESQANVDGQPGVDISDLSAVIDYLYISFTPPAACRW
jgi:Zn-dependent metalloprotease